MRAARRRAFSLVLVIGVTLLWAALAFAAGSVAGGHGASWFPQVAGLT